MPSVELINAARDLWADDDGFIVFVEGALRCDFPVNEDIKRLSHKSLLSSTFNFGTLSGYLLVCWGIITICYYIGPGLEVDF